MRSKLPNQIELDELLNIIKSEESTTGLINPIHDVVVFLSTYNIQSGTSPVPGKFLHKLYCNWSKNPVPIFEFYNELSKYIDKNVNKSSYYINKDILKISEDLYKLIKPKRDSLKVKSYKIAFDKFLNRFDITSGSYWIESYVLFHLYDKWTYDQKKSNTLSYKKFMDYCRMYFKHRRTEDNNNYFQINSDLTHILSEQTLKNLRENWPNDKIKKIKV